MAQELDLKRNCPNCGTVRKKNNRFCTKCGTDLARKEGSSPAISSSVQNRKAESLKLLDSLSNKVSEFVDKLRGPLVDDHNDPSRPVDPIKDVPASPTTYTMNAPTVALSNPISSGVLRQNAGMKTDKGLVRDHNEDFVAKMEIFFDQSGSTEPVGLYIVADGMGGHAAGERASEASVKRTFLRYIENNILPDLRERQTRRLDASNEMSSDESMKSLVQEANRLVYQGSQAGNSGRGTTITAALVIGSRATIANVGDSRTYLLRDGRLKLVTQDHSLVYSLYKAGQISKADIYTHPQKNEIYRSLGDKEKVDVDIFSEDLLIGDQLLLCSDGLWEMVHDPEIVQIMVSASTQNNACDRLVLAANNNGGEDNISAIIVTFE